MTLPLERRALALHGPRLTLMALDADAVEAAAPPPHVQGTDGFFAARLREDPGAIGYWLWTAALADGTVVGFGGFGGRPGDDRRLTVGYSVHEEHQGRGYATEMLELLTAWALAQDGVDHVRATIRPDNTASRRVAAKAGYVATGARVRDERHGELLVYVRRGGSAV